MNNVVPSKVTGALWQRTRQGAAAAVTASTGRAPGTVTGDRAGAMADGMATVAGSLASAAKSVMRLRGIRGMAIEAAWLATRAMLYPLGAVAGQLRKDGPYRHYRTDELSPLQRGLVISAMEAAGTPIVLVHGIIDNRSAFAVLATALRRRGFGVVHAVNYSVLTALTSDVREAAVQLAKHVEQVCAETNAEQVHIVGHSLGGLIARYYVQRLGGDARVNTLVTLGTPHAGTLTAYLLPPTPLARQLRPGSELLTELDQPASGCRTRFVAVWSELDQVIVPQQSARLEHPDLAAKNLQLSDAGHISLPVDPRVTSVVIAALSRPDRPEWRFPTPESDQTAELLDTFRHIESAEPTA